MPANNPFAQYAPKQEEPDTADQNPFSQYSKPAVEQPTTTDDLPPPGQDDLGLGLPPAPALKRKELTRNFFTFTYRGMAHMRDIQKIENISSLRLLIKKLSKKMVLFFIFITL